MEGSQGHAGQRSEDRGARASLDLRVFADHALAAYAGEDPGRESIPQAPRQLGASSWSGPVKNRTGRPVGPGARLHPAE